MEAHRIRHLYNRGRALVDKSPAREHLYEVAGDLILGTEQRLDRLEAILDRTSYALAKVGADHLRDRLSLQDRNVVDEAVMSSHPLRSPSKKTSAAQRVAAQWLASQED